MQVFLIIGMPRSTKNRRLQNRCNYVQNKENVLVNRKEHYSSNQESVKANSKAAYDANPDVKRQPHMLATQLILT